MFPKSTFRLVGGGSIALKGGFILKKVYKVFDFGFLPQHSFSYLQSRWRVFLSSAAGFLDPLPLSQDLVLFVFLGGLVNKIPLLGRGWVSFFISEI
jgi:hypothetical protein